MLGARFLQGTSVTLRYFHQDHLGSNGALAVPREAYDAWGKRCFANGTDDLTGSIGSQTTEILGGPCRRVVTPGEPR